jgi:outer membrane protein OmpA-like peptidoglycan-associated protein
MAPAVIVSVVMLVSCGQSAAMRGRIDGLTGVVREAEKNGAMRCAPRELALAKAHLHFAATDLDQGVPSDAQNHLEIAEPNAHAALAMSPVDQCTEEVVKPREGDRDGDGIADAFDQCPDQRETYNGFEDLDGCPDDPDSDGDGIPDSRDACRLEPEDKDGYLDDDGCPEPDNDLDGIADAKDKCPNEPEDPDGFQDDDGCPDPDNDGDGVPDAADKCVDQPETRNGFEDDDGCPDEIPEKLRKFTGAIQGVTFKTNSADLAGASARTLDKAVAVLAEFKDIKLEIQGHTDDQPLKNTKTFADNAALSQARADTVKTYFVTKGIDESRLTAKGYGDSAPVDAPAGLKGGKLTAARAKNRRVEFKLVSALTSAPAAAPATP